MKSPFVPLAVALLLASPRVMAQDLNTITKVEVKGGTIEILGTKKPNFTTFTMTDPPRLVIDISEAVFSGVPEEMQVGNGTVTALKTASYGSDASAIARVLIGFTRDMEPDIQADGTKLVIRVAGGSAAPAVAAADAPKGTEAASAAQEQEAAQRAEAARLAQEKAAQEQEAAQRAEAARLAQEKAAQGKAAQEQQAAQRTEAERLAQEKAAQEREAAQRAEADRLAQEKAAQEREAARQADADRLAQQRATQEKAAQEREASRRVESERVAMVERTPAPRPSRASRDPSESLSVSARRKTMTLVGFKQGASTSQVFVRTNEPVRYSVSRGGDKSVILELENTRIALDNNERFLDTSFFDTAVAMITPQHSASRTVRIEIKLKEIVPYEARQEGNEVYLDFQRPQRQ